MGCFLGEIVLIIRALGVLLESGIGGEAEVEKGDFFLLVQTGDECSDGRRAGTDDVYHWVIY